MNFISNGGQDPIYQDQAEEKEEPHETVIQRIQMKEPLTESHAALRANKAAPSAPAESPR